MNILCLAGYEKGHDFLSEAKRQGCTVTLLTSLKLKDTAQWPLDSIDEIFYMPDDNYEWNRQDTIKSVSFLARTRDFARIVALDDFDVELAASLREHLRMPGIGDSQARLFRDKLAMRMAARSAGIRVPEFTALFNYDRIREFFDRVSPPWVLKPRSLAGAIGIKKVNSAEDFWRQLDSLGDMQSNYLLEQYVPGDVFHVDTLMYDGNVQFACASAYGRPPMDVSHGGGVFATRTLDANDPTDHQLLEMNARLLTSFALQNGASHSEFIRAHQDGAVYFLETSARVGGAHIADLVQAATGVNLWAEWAKIEASTDARPYSAPQSSGQFAGLLISLAREENPDTSAYSDPEIVWRMKRPYHVGLIVRSPEMSRVQNLLASYAERVQRDFGATLPPRDKPDA